ncbi:MAG: rhomboid family intramembrane serine protease [Burkholderiales bacterium]
MPPVTLALIAANVAVYLLQSSSPMLLVQFALWPLDAASASGGQVAFHFWQILTYGFLHGGLTHLLFNMFALYMFGGALEQVVGPRRYLAYYLVCVATAAITQLAVMAFAREIYPTVGASGGVFGLLLAYAIYFPNNRVFFLLIPFPIKARVFVLIYAALELFLGVTGTQEGVAHFAHLGGLVGGALMIAYWRRGRFSR